MSAAGHVELYCPTCERSYHTGRLCEVDGTELVNLGGGADPLLGRALNDRYTIQERLGAGGMGTVYRGVQHSVGREVAIKVVSAGLVTDPAAIKRFLREAKLASRLSHPNAVSMLDFGQTPDGLFYLVMELLVGRTLDKVLREEVRLSLPRVLRIASQVCDALDGAHRLNIIHRDLKPANVMLLDGDRDLIKVLDFGLAKSLSNDTTSMTMTASGAMLGTPAYMSPEAALGRELDARCDLYSLGCMLYVLASGRLPFHSESVHELVAMHAMEPPPPITGVPQPVGDVIMRLLAKEPADRYESAAAAREALEAAAARASTMDNLGTRATTPAPVPPAHVDVNAVTVHSGAAVVQGAPSKTDVVGVAAASSVVTPAKSRMPIVLGAVVVAGGLVAGFMAMKGGGDRTSGADAKATTSSSTTTPAATPASTTPAKAAPSNADTPSSAAGSNTAASNTTASTTAPSNAAASNAAPANTASSKMSSKIKTPSKAGSSKAAPSVSASAKNPSAGENPTPPAETKSTTMMTTTTPPVSTTPPATTPPATTPPATTTPPKKGTPW